MYATHQPLEVDRSRTRIFGYRLHRRSDADGILADGHGHQCGAILVYTTLSSAKEWSNLPKLPTWVRKTWS